MAGSTAPSTPQMSAHVMFREADFDGLMTISRIVFSGSTARSSQSSGPQMENFWREKDSAVARASFEVVRRADGGEMLVTWYSSSSNSTVAVVGLLACQTRLRSSMGSLENGVKVDILVLMVCLGFVRVLVMLVLEESVDKYCEVV